VPTARRPPTGVLAGCTRSRASTRGSRGPPRTADRERARPPPPTSSPARTSEACWWPRWPGGGTRRRQVATAWTSWSPRAMRRAGTRRDRHHGPGPRDRRRGRANAGPGAGRDRCGARSRGARLGAVGAWMGRPGWSRVSTSNSPPAPAGPAGAARGHVLGHDPVQDLSVKPARLLKNKWTDAWEQEGAPSRSACRCRTCWSARRTSA